MESPDNAALDQVRTHLLKSRGLDTSGYSRAFVLRCIRKRMGRVKKSDVHEYVRLLSHSEDETSEFVGALSINVTEFFRDEGAFEALSSLAIRPALVAKTETPGILRIWSAGCATGQETYTVAMCLEQELKRAGIGDEFLASITGTDMSKSAISKAKLGVYASDRTQGIPSHLLKDYFVRRDGQYEVSQKLKRRVRFYVSNLMDPPRSRFFDIVVCRNVLIYFSRPSHDNILMNLASALKTGGYLMLGRTETLLGEPRASFKMIDAENRIFRKIA